MGAEMLILLVMHCCCCGSDGLAERGGVLGDDCRRVGVSFELLEVGDDSVVVAACWSVRREGSPPIRTLLTHDSLDLVKGPVCGHSFTVDGLSQSGLAGVRDAELLLAIATASGTALLRILSQNIESFLLIDGSFVIDYLIYLII